jgi:alpha-L-rhamnosidase
MKNLFFLLFFATVNAFAQTIDPSLLENQWKANWISVPNTDPKGYGVYYFRKNFELVTLPSEFKIHVSADNRYKLYVNEKLVSMGPARGDLRHWNFETVDLTPYLQIGKNIVAAQIWNEGEQRPEANLSNQTAFILQGGNEIAQILNTNDTWRCIQDKSYAPIKVQIPTFYVAGSGEFVNRDEHLHNWHQSALDDSQWLKAKSIAQGFPKNKVGYARPSAWFLVPSPIPQMTYEPQRLLALRKADGISVPDAFPATKTPLTVPAHTKVTLLLDQTFLTNAFPTLIFSGGKNSALKIEYCEALFTKYPHKGNRNEIDGKIVLGRKDSIISNGTPQQTFTTLSWRTYRYLQLTINTQSEPLILDDIYGVFTAYPFELKAKITTQNTDIQKMLDIGWRTARLCATETYMDCPYYEQLQYIGDTRIQALVSLYNSGDDRLVKNALNQFSYSQEPEGMTQSRYPTTTPQYIPPFSLWYIGMLHDYMRYGQDTDFLKSKLNSMRQILAYFSQFQQADGSIKKLPWWNFTDWVDIPTWQIGTRSAGKDGCSAVLDLQLLYALQAAIDIEKQVGSKEYEAIFSQKAALLQKTIPSKYWDATKNRYADRTEKDLFSQHANALALLTGLVPPSATPSVSQAILSDKTLAPSSIYFKYYIHQALIKAGLGNDYLNWLDKWRENIQLGLTTWGETSDVENTRSDCHAWGASPNIEFFRTILGIDSDAPAFKAVKIEPHLGDIQKISGEMPHPNGKIAVAYEIAKGKLNVQIELPPSVQGRFIWKGKTFALKAGGNNFSL